MPPIGEPRSVGSTPVAERSRDAIALENTAYPLLADGRAQGAQRACKTFKAAALPIGGLVTAQRRSISCQPARRDVRAICRTDSINGTGSETK